MARIRKRKAWRSPFGGVAHPCVRAQRLRAAQGPLEPQGFPGHGPRTNFWRRETCSRRHWTGCNAPKVNPVGLHGCKWEENQALTCQGPPDHSLVSRTDCYTVFEKTWFVQTVYIFLYIPIYIYNLYKHTMKESQGLRLARRAALFLLYFFFFSLFLIFIQTSLFCSFAFIEYYYQGKRYRYSTRTTGSWVKFAKLTGKSPALT